MSFESRTYCLEQVQLIRLDRASVFRFFSDASNLERLTPPFLNFEILTPTPIDIQADTLIDYRIRLFGIPMNWRTRIESFEPDECFVDTQIRGPYALWHHTHTFEETPDGTVMRDTVRYRLPFGWLGVLVHAVFVRRTLERIFEFRRASLSEILEPAES